MAKKRTAAEAETVATIRQRRDAREKERRKLEDAAIKAYAKGEARRRAIEDQERDELAALRVKMDEAREAKKVRLGEVDREQGEALGRLKESGRNVAGIAELTGLAEKRVRALLAAAKEHAAVAPSAVSVPAAEGNGQAGSGEQEPITAGAGPGWPTVSHEFAQEGTESVPS
ncbi:MAG: hypothetical protein J2P17_03635 [Mycobacterium sp.]|nr:hypothetical protein [Mycobacterium sp.]